MREVINFHFAFVGYSGDGVGTNGCSDINECSANAHNCADEATCVNSGGGFTCQCKAGFNGNGYQCSGRCPGADPEGGPLTLGF